MFSRKDLYFNYENFGKSENILFITGIFGSGKSYLGRKFEKELGAIHINQDWLCWSECYDSETSKSIVSKFQQMYPETIELFEKQAWHNDDAKWAREKYRPLFDKMVIDYASENKDKLFVYEGSDLYYRIPECIYGMPLIIKRTSVLHSMARMIKRRKTKGNWISRYFDIQKLHKKLKLSLRNERKKLNRFIKTLLAV